MEGRALAIRVRGPGPAASGGVLVRRASLGLGPLVLAGPLDGHAHLARVLLPFPCQPLLSASLFLLELVFRALLLLLLALLR